MVLPDGCLMHLGRKDFQVKVRGHRIEVAEIEMALLAMDTIKETIVLACADQNGDQRLVAYIVPEGESAPTVSILRRTLAERLPDYMIPSVFMMLDALPLNPTGKVDRLTLPAPGISRLHLDTPFALPRTPVEETLVDIWSEILGLDRVGVHDNFLELGGHSLSAMRIISRVFEAFQVEVSARSLFQADTVADIAVIITKNQAERVGSEDTERVFRGK